MTYSIGEVEELTGIKAHVLRYWEEVVPGFSPQKDMGGRRTYTQREVEIIFRLKYLINEKKFTAEGAGQQILEESQALEENADLIRQIHEARSELADTYLKLKRLSQACGQSAHTDSSEPQQHSSDA
ncbi:MAG: MerR family transcriptional regulator [Treponema sp.]|jgi:DNA-binding transcriptional MerR regulator|nr:MerR family transcriptional regulator [Treponema sp.]